MLRVESCFVFKRHYVSSRGIAEEIKSDLELRIKSEPEFQDPQYKDVKVTIEEPYPEVPNAMWDPGGMCMMNDEVFSFTLGDIVVKCKAQHFEYFVETLNSDNKHNRVRGTRHPYHKIHGYWECICLGPEEFKFLKEMVKDPEKAVKARDAWNTLQQKLFDAKVVKAVEKEDGAIGYYHGLLKKPPLN